MAWNGARTLGTVTFLHASLSSPLLTCRATPYWTTLVRGSFRGPSCREYYLMLMPSMGYLAFRSSSPHAARPSHSSPPTSEPFPRLYKVTVQISSSSCSPEPCSGVCAARHGCPDSASPFPSKCESQAVRGLDLPKKPNDGPQSALSNGLLSSLIPLCSPFVEVFSSAGLYELLYRIIASSLCLSQRATIPLLPLFASKAR